jgi:hypothetical protein
MRGILRRAVIAGALAGPALVACSLELGGGLAPSAVAPGTDASPDVRDGGAVAVGEAGADAPFDAGQDAAADVVFTDAPAPPPTWCQTQDASFVFCSDFDRSADVRAEWCQGTDASCVVSAPDAAVVSINTAQPASAPNVLYVQSAPVGATFTQAVAARYVSQRTGKLHAQADVRVEASSNGTAALLVVLMGDYDPGRGGHTVALVASRENASTFSVSMEEYYPLQPLRTSSLATGVTVAAWHHLEITLDDAVDASGQTLVVSLDANRIGTILLWGTQDATRRQLQVGIPYVLGPSSAWIVKTDNVLVRQP